MHVAEMNQVEIFNMRKSILMGTKEDVQKMKAKRAVTTTVRHKPLMTNEQLQEFINEGLKQSKARIVTFNHPCIQ